MGLEDLVILFTREIGLVQGTEPWWAMRHAKETVTTYKIRANIAVMMRVMLLETKHRLKLGHDHSKDVCVFTKNLPDALST